MRLLRCVEEEIHRQIIEEKTTTAKVMGITVEEGNAFANKFIDAFKAGFVKNNHRETMGPIFSDKVTWNWSDGVKGSGDPAPVWEVFQKTWGFMVSSAKLCTPHVLVDTTNSKVIIMGDLVINIDGGLPGQAHLVQNKICFNLTLEGGKACTWDCSWNNEEPTMLAALSEVSAALADAKEEKF